MPTSGPLQPGEKFFQTLPISKAWEQSHHFRWP